MARRYWYAFASILLFLVVSIGVSGWIWSRYQSSQPPSNHQGSTTQPAAQPTSTPQITLDMQKGAKLVIPSIGVSASIEAVGKDKAGHMDIPHQNQWENVGWYRNGPIPGQPGSAVIDGHLDRPGGVPAVFWDLHKVKVGDEVLVQDSKGHILHFRVYKTQMYEPENAPINDIFLDKTGTYLNLITCAGQWIPAKQQTTHRLVVYTKLQESDKR